MSDEESSLSESGLDYEPVDSSGTLTDSSDIGVVVPVKVRHTRPHAQVAEVVQSHDSCMQQSASTSELVSTSGQYILLLDTPKLQ